MRIVQLANFYGPRSGGLRTALHQLGAGYAARGHETILVVPGRRAGDERLVTGVRRITLAAPKIPGTGGYRLLDPWRVCALLGKLRPDHIEVSDRLTLRGLGAWASRRKVSSVVISHERLDRLLVQFLLPAAVATAIADRANTRMAARYDSVVCTTEFAQQEFDRIGAANVSRVPLGVDLQTFHPDRRDETMRARFCCGAEVLLVHCGRLSPEKHAERSIEAAAALHHTGHRVQLVIAGDGPRLPALRRRADGLPVRFLGFVSDRDDVARLLASADVVLAPGPHETFGLAALEALACGTPVVVSRSSALPEVITPDCGVGAMDDADAFAAGVLRLLAGDERLRRLAARARAEQFDWRHSVDGMLATLAVGERFPAG